MKALPKAFLVRLREKDSPIGISAETLNKLTIQLNLSKTEVTHLALRKLADELLGIPEKETPPPTASKPILKVVK